MRYWKPALSVISIFALLGILALLQPTVAPAVVAESAATRYIYLPLVTKPCVSQQLVQDSSFESGLPNSYWVTTSTIASGILDNTPNVPSPNATHTGTWKAWLGGSNSVQEALYQTLVVPASTTSLHVSFWRYITTQEPSPLVNDRLDIQIRNTSGTALETLYTLWDGDANTGSTWTQHVLTATNSYAGQTIQLAFFAKTDSTYPTSFFVDDVLAQTYCGQ